MRSPSDGRAVAYVISADHGDVVELVARNLVTGRRNTIIMATRPDPDASNWPPGVFGLTWASDDVHLAVQLGLTAAINGVLVFDAFTAATAGDGRIAPAPCAVAYNYQCEGFDPGYLASGALTYVIQRLSRSGAASASLVAWQAGHRRTLLSLSARICCTGSGCAAKADASTRASSCAWPTTCWPRSAWRRSPSARRKLIATGEKVRKPSVENVTTLTAREAYIARLARDGCTNPEIGTQLFLSARPKRSSAPPTIRAAVAGSVMSSATVSRSGSSDDLIVRAVATTAQPRVRYPPTSPAPMPWEPPVMTATLPVMTPAGPGRSGAGIPWVAPSDVRGRAPLIVREKEF